MPPTATDIITSLDNPLVRLAHSLQTGSGRRRSQAFLVEGRRLIAAGVATAAPLLVLHTPDFGRSNAPERALLRLARAAGAPVREVSERVLAHVAGTVTPQGVVAAMPMPRTDQTLCWPSEDRLGSVRDDEPHCGPGSGPLLLLDGVGDPGNAGTLLRSAVGAGVAHVWCAKGTVDVFSPKVVRAGAGAHFHCALAIDLEWDTIGAHLPAGVPVLIAEATARQRYWEVDWTEPGALILGSEAHGPSEAARALATGAVSIPITHVESLNVGVAGSIILFEALRQRLAARALDARPTTDNHEL